VSYNLAERYTLLRLRSIAIVAVFAAAVAWVAGFPGASWGALASCPVAMFNYFIVYRAVHRAEREKSTALRGILTSSLSRMLLSLATLWVASRFGIDVMLGALAALVSEMLLYTGDTVRSVISLKRG